MKILEETPLTNTKPFFSNAFIEYIATAGMAERYCAGLPLNGPDSRASGSTTYGGSNPSPGAIIQA